MTRGIITVNGVRYRADTPWTPEYDLIVIERNPKGRAEPEQPGESAGYSIMPLPHVPDWPLPGVAPQYIAERPLVSQLRKGDLVLTLQPELRSWRWNWDFDATRSRDHEWHGYLIARKGPEEDA